LWDSRGSSSRFIETSHFCFPVYGAAFMFQKKRLDVTKMLAVSLNLPRSCIYEYAKAKRIPCVRVGKHVRFDPAAVRTALENTGGLTVGPD
jgi:excisionase family DNA binding protein